MSALVLDGYIRVSRVGGRSGDSFISPDVQRRAIADYAARMGYRVDRIHEDLDRSGGTLRRPGFQEALARIERGASAGLIVPRLDRFGRSVARIHEALERIHRAGAQLLSVAEDFDLSTAAGKAHLNMLGLMAQYQRDLAIEAWDVSNQNAIARGIHFTAQVPFGYVRNEEDRRLYPHPTNALYVGEVFRRRALGVSWPKLAAYLNEKAPRADGRLWRPRNAATIVKSRTYLGVAFHGKHENPNAHAPLVTRDEWEAANAIKGGPGALPPRSHLLSGVVRCAGCRYAMRRTYIRLADGSRSYHYQCSVTHSAGRCPEPANVAASLIEPLVVGFVLGAIGRATWSSRSADEDALGAAERQLAHAEQRLADFLADDELREVVGREAFLRQAAERRAAVERAQEELAQAREQARILDRRTFTLSGEWDEWPLERRADALRAVLDAVYVRKASLGGELADRVLILWEGEDQLAKPTRGTNRYRIAPVPWPETLLDEHALGVPALRERAMEEASERPELEEDARRLLVDDRLLHEWAEATAERVAA